MLLETIQLDHEINLSISLPKANIPGFGKGGGTQVATQYSTVLFIQALGN